VPDTPAAARPLAEAELERLARQGLRSHPSDYEAAVRAFQDAVEKDPKLLVALVTRKELTRIVRAYVQKVQLSDVGKKLHEGIGRVPPARKEEDEKLRERWNAVREEARSVMWTFMVAGKALALCSRAEVEKEAAETGRRAEFLRALLKVMPENPKASVKDALTPKKVEELWAGTRVAA
jgi:hypothetical protein